VVAFLVNSEKFSSLLFYSILIMGLGNDQELSTTSAGSSSSAHNFAASGDLSVSRVSNSMLQDFMHISVPRPDWESAKIEPDVVEKMAINATSRFTEILAEAKRIARQGNRNVINKYDFVFALASHTRVSQKFSFQTVSYYSKTACLIFHAGGAY